MKSIGVRVATRVGAPASRTSTFSRQRVLSMPAHEASSPPRPSSICGCHRHVPQAEHEANHYRENKPPSPLWLYSTDRASGEPGTTHSFTRWRHVPIDTQPVRPANRVAPHTPSRRAALRDNRAAPHFKGNDLGECLLRLLCLPSYPCLWVIKKRLDRWPRLLRPELSQCANRMSSDIIFSQQL